jgi:uncharacterized protein YyaL (SSP411 family)
MNTMATTKIRKNKLSSELSPYLQQHATNKVQWYPWGNIVFAQAKKQDKPIFLSIGYATCHWCHVMAHESFEDDEVAQVLNDTFICIKVDREERPDLDNFYMKVCQKLTGSGGWPLSIIMTPDKKPFFAATYIPKTTRFGRSGIIELTAQIQNLWKTQREKIETSAEEITTTLCSFTSSQSIAQHLDRQVLDRAYEQLVAAFDEHYGGFSSAPKFPTPHNLLFLLRYWNRTKNPYALTMVERTLEQMRLGGIFDQIGYGFHRYATDQKWNIPHFEKMLYDQALLILTYTEAYQITNNPFYRQVAQEVITYVLREMTSHAGAFYTAQDADSEGEEGKFYTWTSKELRKLLSQDEFHLMTTIFDLTKDGNTSFETTQQLKRNILFHQQTFKESAQRLQLSEEELTKKIKEITTKLYYVRKKRVPPLKDDKILSDWNGLMIAALAKAGAVFCEDSYIKTAEKAAGFLQKNMMKKTGEMFHRFRNGKAGIQGFADDYAFTIWGFLELYQATFNLGYLRTAQTLNQHYLDHFWDNAQKGFFFSETTDVPLPRTKEWHDGAIPSANSVSTMNLLRLSRLTANTKLEKIADALFRSISGEVASVPTGYTCLLAGIDFALGPSKEILMVGEPESDDIQKFLTEIHRTYLPNMVVILLSPQIDRLLYREVFPFADSYSQIDRKATVYVCTNHQCQNPVTTVQELSKLLV